MQLDHRHLTPQTWTAYILMLNEANEVHLRKMDPRRRLEVLTALKDYGEKMGFGFPDSFNTYLPKSGHEHGANAELAESGDPGKPTPPDARPRKPGRSKARK